jgi:CRP-like cAMP-binding protein
MNLQHFFQTIPEFSEMTNDDLDKLERALVVREHKDGEEFLRQGSGANDLYFIIEGEVEILHQEAGGHGEQVIKTMQPGELVGLHSLISHRPTSAYCRTKGQTKLASLPMNAFNLLYQANSPLTHHFQRVIARQLVRDYRQVMSVIKSMMLAQDEKQAEQAMAQHVTGG